MWDVPLDALVDLACSFGNGVALALRWLRTRNSLVAVGVDALSDVPARAASAPPGSDGARRWRW